MTNSTTLVAIAGCIALAACRTPTTDEQLDTVRSWTAAVRLATAERTSQAINAATATQLRDQAHLALDDAKSKVPRQPAVDSLARALSALDAVTRR